MKLIIDVTEKDYNEVIDYGITTNPGIAKAIKHGIPLPKRHGRMIILSEDAVKREQTSLSFSCQNWISEVGLSNATVAIIEADKEKEE